MEGCCRRGLRCQLVSWLGDKWHRRRSGSVSRRAASLSSLSDCVMMQCRVKTSAGLRRGNAHRLAVLRSVFFDTLCLWKVAGRHPA